LREKIAGITAIQGVFVQVFGVGIIIQGESGLGKTECALELITRGHRFISDDLIEIYKARNITVFGRSPKISRNLLYVKGIGIINTKDLYGPGSVLNAAKVDMIVEFLEWDKGINLLGNELILKKIFDLDIPITRIPVRPNQMTTIIELIAKKFLYENSSKRRKKYFGE
jgi:HPr kinase/phosphorylase